MNLQRTRSVILAMSFLCLAGINASAQLVLDNFTAGPYSKYLVTAQTVDKHFEPLAAASPVGADRYTVLTLGSNAHKQLTRLDVGHGICIVDTGFGAYTGLAIYYGITAGGDTPLGLNLSAYSQFQLTFAGVSAAYPLSTTMVVWLSNGSIVSQELSIPPSVDPETVAYPFSGFQSSDFSDINYIGIVIDGGGLSPSYGLTLFQAAP